MAGKCAQQEILLIGVAAATEPVTELCKSATKAAMGAFLLVLPYLTYIKVFDCAFGAI